MTQNKTATENEAVNPAEESMTIVEQTLRSQREIWSQIVERVKTYSDRDFPHEGPKRILLFGLGSSFFASRLIAFTLMRDKTRARTPVLSCPAGSVGVEIQPQKGDWAFGITHRAGASSQVCIDALQACARAGAFTIQVSAKGAKQLDCAHFFLETGPLEKVEPHTVAVTSAVCAVTSLLLGAKGYEEWDALQSIGDPDLNLLRRRALEGPTVIVGENEGEWLAHEGALKIMEMVRVPVRSYSSEEYFHGPRLCATRGKFNDRVWHVSLPGDPRASDLAALKPHYTVGVYGRTPLAWVPALVELQWLALAVALNCGVNPDT